MILNRSDEDVMRLLIVARLAQSPSLSVSTRGRFRTERRVRVYSTGPSLFSELKCLALVMTVGVGGSPARSVFAVLLLVAASVLLAGNANAQTCSCPSSSCSQNPGSGYCESLSYYQVSVTASRTVYTTLYTKRSYDCSWGWGDTCYGTSSKKAAKTVYTTNYLAGKTCNAYCCQGYTSASSATRTCKPICVLSCQNGGTCSAPSTCTCTSSWTGSTCITPVCSQGCSNGGTCTNPNTCSCTSQWSGSTCQTPVCFPACSNGGTCSSPGVCQCASGWSGSRCDDPVCSPACEGGGTCIAPDTCMCPGGLEGNTCGADVDECATGEDNCEQVCINLSGSFRCGCDGGYTLNGNGFSCSDVDECVTGEHDCEQTCTNTVGSYRCGCSAGYLLQTDRKTCTDFDECEESPCDHTCTNTIGSYDCGCNTGYRLEGSSTCADIDECTESSPCDQQCTNTPGSYACGCDSGYSLAADGETCEDIDECASDINMCQQHCENIPGSFSCFCDAGNLLQSDGTSCEEFSITDTTITLPMNTDFLNTIKDGLDKCLAGSICTCINDLLTSIADLGFSQDLVQHEDQRFSISFGVDQQQAISDFILAVFGADSTIALPIMANLQEMAYNCTNQELYVDTVQAGGDFVIFPNILILSNVNLQVAISSITTSPTLEQLRLAGTIVLGDLEFSAFVETKNPEVWYFGATLEGDGDAGIIVDGKVNLFNFISSVFEVDLPSEPFGDLVTISNIAFNGRMDISNNFDLILTFEATVHVGDWYDDRLCLIVHQTLQESGRSAPAVAFLSGCDSFGSGEGISLAEMIQGLLDVDISGVPFFGTFMLPEFHIVYTTSNFDLLGTDFGDLDLPDFGDLSIGNFTGFQFNFNFEISGISFPWQIARVNGTTLFKPASLLSGFSITDVLSAISSVLNLPDVDALNSQLDGFQLTTLDLDVDGKTFALGIEVPEPISIFFDDFQVINLVLDFELTWEGGLSFTTINLEGTLMLGSQSFVTSISLEDSCYTLSACAPDFEGGIGAIASAFGSSLSDSFALSTFGFDSIGLNSPCIDLAFKAGQFPDYMCFSADLFRSEFADVGLSTCITQDKKWVIGLEVREFVLATLLEEIIGSTGRQVALFNQMLDTAIVVSPITIDGLPLRGFLLEEFTTVLQGTTIQARSRWPENCDSDAFCSVAQGLLGADASFDLIVHILGSTVSVEASVANFELGSFTLSTASIQMTFSPSQFSLGIAAEMIIDDPPITLGGAFRLNFPQASLSLEMFMTGCYENAFGISILDICDFFISVTITPGSALPGVAFGVTVKVGEEACNIIEATGFFSVDPNSPVNNYFYVSISSLTFQGVVDLFCVDLTLPDFLGGTGFPEGFTTSFASIEHVLPDLGITIPKGFYFDGVINIFGLIVDCEMILDPPELIDVYARLYPLTLGGGLLKMYESRDVTDQGPFLHVVVGSNPQKFEVEASGYVSVFGIEIEAMLKVSDDGYEINIYGNIFGVLEVELFIKASIGNVLDASYQVAGKLATTIQQDIQDAVVGLIDSAAEGASDAIGDIQATVEGANADFDAAVEDLEAAQAEVADARNEVNSIRNEINGIRDGLCTIQSCGDICVPLLCGGCGCWVRVWGECVVPCLEWSDCCFKIPDPICLLENLACYILKGLAEIAIALAQLALIVAEGVLYVVEAVIHGLTVIVDNARFILDIAIAALEAIKVLVSVGLAALSAITQFLLTGIINIMEIGFDVQIAALSDGSISAYVEASFFGSAPVRLSVTLPIINPLGIVKDLAERAIPGLGRKKRSMSGKNKVLWLAQRFKKEGRIYPTTWGS